MSLKRVSIPSPNQSGRAGATVRLLVLHTTEGARTYQELGNYFAKTSTQASSHVGIDDTANTVGEYVQRGQKAWTCANANPVSVNAELCAFADWTSAQWEQHPNLLANCAAWIAEEAKAFGLPITKLTPEQAQGTGRGVCQHKDLGTWGGGHHDCGPGFPIDRVLDMARGGGDNVTPGYPAWFWDWNDWYINTSRDPDARPKDAPHQIPQWAWDGQREILHISRRYGMSPDERDWLAWYVDTPRDQTKRPDVPEAIPEHWWDDESWLLEQLGR